MQEQENLFPSVDELHEEIKKAEEEMHSEIKRYVNLRYALELTREPREVIAIAKSVSDELFAVIEKKPDWVVVIEGKEFLTFPAWQFIAACFSLTPEVESVRELHDKDGNLVGFEVTAVVRNRFGEVMSRAVARCDRNELMPEYEYRVDPKTGKRVRVGLKGYVKRFDEKKSDHVVLATAQTRAMRRALWQVLNFVVALHGYEPVPAEEAEEA